MKLDDSSALVTRREFVGAGARAAALAALTPLALPAKSVAAEKAPGQKRIGIQVGAVSFVDEGTEQVLDLFQERGAVDTIFLTTFTYGRGLGGRQVPGQPFPDHGKQESDEKTFHGGNYATPHPEFYKNTGLKQTRAPDHGDLDIVATVLPAARKRGMKLFCSVEDVFRSDVPGAREVTEVDLQGRKTGTLSCFCQHHQKAARAAGLRFERAREGYLKLDQFVQGALQGHRPSDGYFVEFWRLLVEYPEIIAWDRLFDEAKHQVLAEIYDAVKSGRKGRQVGFHIEHVNSFNPIFRATRRYDDLATKADFLKVVVYNNCGGERYASFIRNVGSTVFRDVPQEELLRFNNHLLNYEKEAGLDDLAAAGLSPDYVARETKRALDGVQGKCRILPGIDIGIPVGKNSRKALAEDTYAATAAALKAGADGVIFSRKYSEMRLANLESAGRAVRESARDETAR